MEDNQQSSDWASELELLSDTSYPLESGAEFQSEPQTPKPFPVTKASPKSGKGEPVCLEPFRESLIYYLCVCAGVSLCDSLRTAHGRWFLVLFFHSVGPRSLTLLIDLTLIAGLMF